MLAGGAIGATMFGPLSAGAQTGSTTTTTAAPNPNAVGHSNEDPAHEGKESPEREKAEDAGQGFGPHAGVGHRGAFTPNEDPTHEANESPEREAQEHETTPTTATPAAPAPSGSGAST
jgi:hypothetical protein